VFNIDNLTVVYLIGLVSLSYGVVQALTLKDERHSSRIWAAGQILLGLGFVGLVYFGNDPLPKAWIGSYALLILGALTQLAAIARFGKNPIPPIPAVSCLAALAGVIFLFETAKQLGAPLASLETFLFAPLAAIYIYMAWFSWKMGRISNSIYLTLNSAAFWLYATLMVITAFLSLFGLGQGLIDINSFEVRILALASLVLSLLSNYLWSIQAAELSQTDIHLVNFDIALEAKAKAIPVFVKAESTKGQYKTPKKSLKDAQSDVKKASPFAEISSTKTEPVEKMEKSYKASFSKSAGTHVDDLSPTDQAGLFATLTEREKEVFMLAADGMKNGQIAQALNSSESSVKVHRSRMVAKLGTSEVESFAKLKQSLGLTIDLTELAPSPVQEQLIELSQIGSKQLVEDEPKPPQVT